MDTIYNDQSGFSTGKDQPCVDPDQIGRFVHALFVHAREGGFVALRAFYDDEASKRRPEPAYLIRGIRLNGAGLDPVIAGAVKMAHAAAEPRRSVVFAPPIATFASGKAREGDLLEGLTVSVELDEHATTALAKGRGLIGRPTIVMASGGQWADPATGEIEDKLHVHWRLSEPAGTPEEHAKLKRARSLLCDLLGADATSKSAVHPMRWAGSLHRKNPGAPRLARIVEENPEAEVHLDDVLSELEGLAAMHGEADASGPKHDSDDPHGDDELLMACADRIANPDLDWTAWNRLGMAFWRASGGSPAGFAAFDLFSAKSAKYDAAATRARWLHFATSPPSQIGIATLVFEARKADPSFRKKRPDVDISGIMAKARAAQGAGDPEQAEGDELPEWKVTLNAAIDEMNERYFVAGLGGRATVASMASDEVMKRERLVLSRRDDIKLLFNHRHYVTAISLKGNEIWRDLGTAWLENPRRRTYRQIALIPEGPCPSDVFNLWRGFGITPKAGSWATIDRHLREVICSGREDHYAWLLGWLAYCVQHPGKQAEAAVVLRGEKGAGKGLVGQMLLRIFRDHSLHITNSKHLVGNFNAHLVDALFLFLDEAYWAGDKQGEGTLKALITESVLVIEPKGIDSFQMPNRLKILMASNNDWVIPATADERRYFVLDVPSAKKGDKKYFDKLAAAIEGDELAALLHDLLALDLSGFDHRNPPHTDALNRQKLISAESFIRYWYDCLAAGYLIGTGEADWPEDVPCQLLHAGYIDHAHQHGDRHPLTINQIGLKLRTICPPGVRISRPIKEWNGIAKPSRYMLASLDQHRAAFLAAMNIDPAGHTWPSEG